MESEKTQTYEHTKVVPATPGVGGGGHRSVQR